jgi:DNA-binding PadR family transcriptional regulator
MSSKLSPADFLRQLRSQKTQQEVSPVNTDTVVANNDTVVRAAADLVPNIPQAPPAHATNASHNVQPAPVTPVAVMTPAPNPTAPVEQEHLEEVLDRIDLLDAGEPGEKEDGFFPQQPKTIEETGIHSESIERLLLKYLLQTGSAAGRALCRQLQLSFTVLDPLLRQLKQEQILAIVGAAEAGDYIYALTENARQRARRYSEECTYFGAAPVNLQSYIESVAAQTMNGQKANATALKHAFSDLIINDAMLERLGPAVNSGRGCFLYGQPGNGKTSIAERVTASFGQNIWIPRCLEVDGNIMRLFDPQVHEEVPLTNNTGLLDDSDVDTRWVRVKRPTVIAGGELTMDELEIAQHPSTKICESPLQMKSNCGTLVIDDFGRQRMPVDELLNRWIVPLEKRYDFLNLPSGKKIQVPFDQLIIFSTNLEPRDLVDGAFLRRIPYKIEVPDPSEAEFRALFKIMCKVTKIEFKQDMLDYLIETHYKPVERPYRSCQPRDLLLQVRNLCVYREHPIELTEDTLTKAVENYFNVM